MVPQSNWLTRHPFKVEIMGSSPIGITNYMGVIQLVECYIWDVVVPGSSPGTHTNIPLQLNRLEQLTVNQQVVSSSLTGGANIGVAQLAEQQSPKLQVVGSSPTTFAIGIQLRWLKHLTDIQKTIGSNPIIPTNTLPCSLDSKSICLISRRQWEHYPPRLLLQSDIVVPEEIQTAMYNVSLDKLVKSPVCKTVIIGSSPIGDSNIS